MGEQNSILARSVWFYMFIIRCSLLIVAGGLKPLFLLLHSNNNDRRRTLCAPWDTEIYESDTHANHSGYIVLVESYLDCATISESFTQSAKFYKARLSIIDDYSKDFHTISIAQTTKITPWFLPVEQKRKLELYLMNRFFFNVFKNMICASYIVVTVNGTNTKPLISIVVADQLEERILLCLEVHDSYVCCRICTLPTLLPQQKQSSHIWISPSEYELRTSGPFRSSFHSSDARLRMTNYTKWNVRHTVTM